MSIILIQSVSNISASHNTVLWDLLTAPIRRGEIGREFFVFMDQWFLKTANEKSRSSATTIKGKTGKETKVQMTGIESRTGFSTPERGQKTNKKF